MATVFAVSIFVDILVDVTNTTSAPKIQITLLILRRGALPKLTSHVPKALEFQTLPTQIATGPVLSNCCDNTARWEGSWYRDLTLCP